jgi:hypothetical protein
MTVLTLSIISLVLIFMCLIFFIVVINQAIALNRTRELLRDKEVIIKLLREHLDSLPPKP